MKKLLSIILATMLLLSASIAALPAYANNHSDTAFTFNVPISSSNYAIYGTGRAKTDASGSYISSDSGNTNYAKKFVIFGCNQQYNSSSAVNCTKGGYASINPGTKRRVRQYVYENNYSYAYIGIKGAWNVIHREVTGLWSPDSVGSDPYAN